MRTYRGHTTKEREKDTHPGSRHDGLDGANMVLRVGSVDGAKGKGRRNDRDEHEHRNGDRLLVEVGHLLDPVRADRALHVGNDTPAPRLGFVCCRMQDGWRKV